MEVRYTKHAELRMAERNISRKEVEAVLQAPEEEFPEYDGCVGAWAQIDGRGIKVVYTEIDGILVITTTEQSRRLRPWAQRQRKNS